MLIDSILLREMDPHILVASPDVIDVEVLVGVLDSIEASIQSLFTKIRRDERYFNSNVRGPGIDDTLRNHALLDEQGLLPSNRSLTESFVDLQ